MSTKIVGLKKKKKPISLFQLSLFPTLAQKVQKRKSK